MVGKLSEELTGALLETAPVDLTVIDADEKIIWWNHPETRVFKIPEKMVGEDVRKCHSEQVREELERMLKDVGFRILDTSGILFMPGLLRIIDLFLYVRWPGAAFLTKPLISPFAFLYKKFPSLRRHGYLITCIVQKP